jgi:hypothetical protein
MNSPLELRSPAPRADAGNRARRIRNAAIPAAFPIAPQTSFVALWIARRLRLAMPPMRVQAALARLGRAVQ